MKTQIIKLFLLSLFLPVVCFAADNSESGRYEPEKATKTEEPDRNNNGAINPKTGEFYPSAGDGVIDTKTGEFYPKTGDGYIKPRTGEYIPSTGGK